MEQFTIPSLQQRIEEKAKDRLMKDLFRFSQTENEISQQLGSDLFKPQIGVYLHSGYEGTGYKPSYRFSPKDNEKKFMDALLPKYIKQVTDEILDSIESVKQLLDTNATDF